MSEHNARRLDLFMAAHLRYCDYFVTKDEASNKAPKVEGWQIMWRVESDAALMVNDQGQIASYRVNSQHDACVAPRRGEHAHPPVIIE